MEANGSSREAYREVERVQKFFGAVKIGLEVPQLADSVLGFKFSMLYCCTPCSEKCVL